MFTAALILVATRAAIIRPTSSTKTNSGSHIIWRAFLATNYANSSFGVRRRTTLNIKTLLETGPLQWGFGANQCLPLFRPVRSVMISSVGNQWMQGIGWGVHDNESDRLEADLHSETDLGEGCVPVGWQFGLRCLSNAVIPPSKLWLSLLLQYCES